MNAASSTGRSRVPQFLFGTPFVLVGGYFFLAGIGVLPLFSKALVPLWVIACAGLVFLLPGLTLCISALASRADADSINAGRVMRAEEGRSGVLGAWGAALFLSILVTTFWGVILSDAPGSGNMPDWMVVAIIGLFTLIAVATVGAAIYRTLGALRYGEARLVLPAAAQVGGRLRGYVEIPRDDLPPQITVRLQCMRYGVEGNAQSPRATLNGLLKSFWEDSREVAVTGVAGRSRIDINIPIPEGLPASHLPDDSGRNWVIPGQVYCQWKLTVAAEVPGVDLTRTFMAEVSAEETAESGVAPVAELESEPDRAAAAARVAVAELTAGRTPAAVAGRLERLGLSDAVISQVFKEISGDETRSFAPTVRAYLSNLARIQAEVDSGQLILLKRTRAPAQTKKRATPVLPAAAAPTLRATASGAPILLADESTLCSGKWMVGGFLMVWGGLFGGIPAVIGILDAAQRNGGLFLFFLIGCAAFCGGLWQIGQRHSIWLLPAQRRLEERTGVYRADQIRFHDQSRFDRVVTAKSVSRSSRGNTSVTFHVALAQGSTSADASLELGDFSDFDAARAAAMRIAATMSLPLYDLTTESDPKPVVVAASALDAAAMARLEPGWWRQPSAMVLILANLVPVGGVLFAQWEVFPIMLLFWLENVVVGVITVLKILACERGHSGEKFFMVPFFIFHYGMFCFVHGAFVFSLFAPRGESMSRTGGLLPEPSGILELIRGQGLWIAVAALVASHAFSFVVNFLGRGEYRKAEAGKVMMAPYGRIIVLHVVVLVGGFVVMALDAPLIALLLLVILKIIMDVTAHIREHRRLSDATLLAGTSGMAAEP